MQEALGEADSARTRLTVGISDSLPKLTAFRLLEATMHLPNPVRLVCYEDQFEALLADLALHKLDVVLTDRAVRSGTTLRVFSHMVFESATILVGAPALAAVYGAAFPASLDGAPFLLPTRNNALRGRIDEWFEQHAVRPDVVGEFEDNALLNTFGRRGAGLFFAPTAIRDHICRQNDVVAVGRIDSVIAQIYAITSERRLTHPAIVAVSQAARRDVFGKQGQT